MASAPADRSRPKQPSGAQQVSVPPKKPSPRAQVVIVALIALFAVLFAVYSFTGPLRTRYTLKKASLNDLLAASRRDPNNPLPLYYLGVRWLQLGQPANAEQSLRRAADLDPDDEKSWLGAALADADAGNLQEGQGIASLFSSRHPRSADSHFTIAQIYGREGSAQNAHSEALAATAINPQDSAAWLLAGREAALLGNSTEAEADLRRALDEDPQNWRASMELGTQLAAQGQFAQAEARMLKATQLAPSEALPLLYLGKIQLNEAITPAQVEAARQTLLQSSQIQPSNAEVQHQLGLAEMRLGHWADAHTDLAQALRFNSADPAILSDLVAADKHLPKTAQLAADTLRLHQLTDYLNSFQARMKEVQSGPFNAQAVLSLARLCAKNGDNIRAAQLYQVVMSRSSPQAGVSAEAQKVKALAASQTPLPVVSPDPTVLSADFAPVPVLLNDSAAFLKQRDIADAQAAYFNILLSDAKQALAYEGLARVMAAKGSTDQARFYYEKAVRFNPRYWQAEFELAALDNQSGLYKEAAQHYRDGLAIVPNNADGWHSLGTTLVQVDDWYQDAEDAMRHAVQLEPKNAMYLRDLADLQVIRNELGDAEANYRKALASAPNDEVTQTHLANFLIVNRPTPAGLAEADRLLQAAAPIAPNDQAVSYWQGRLALERGNGQAAIPALLYAAEHSHRNEAAEAWYSLSRAYKLTGQDKLASEALTYSDKMRALDVYMTALISQVANHPTDISSSLKLADLYAKDSDFDSSVKQYQEVLHIAPANVAARKQLASLNAYLKAHPDIDTAAPQTP